MNTLRFHRHRRMGGFTLIEIMVVVVIIGLLAAIVAPNVINNLDDAAITRAKQDIRTIESALNQFRVEKFRYPTEEEGLEILLGGSAGVNDEQFREYLSRIPMDPWDREYEYRQPGGPRQDDRARGLQPRDRDFDVFTYGADGEEGGEGVDADIGNWNLD